MGAIDFLKEISPKGNQSWIFTARTDTEAETPILGPPDAKNWLLVKVPDAGKYWRQEEKGMTEDEMVGWHHWIDGCEFEQAPGVGGSLACCMSCKESDTTEQLNWTDWMGAMVYPPLHLRICTFFLLLFYLGKPLFLQSRDVTSSVKSSLTLLAEFITASLGLP